MRSRADDVQDVDRYAAYSTANNAMDGIVMGDESQLKNCLHYGLTGVDMHTASTAQSQHFLC